MDCEYLCAKESRHADLILGAMQEAAGGVRTRAYTGRHHVLMLWGAGHPAHAAAAQAHLASGRPVVQWDLGYTSGHYRVAVNDWHPTPAQMDATPNDPARWDSLGIGLREDGDPSGPVLLIGMGPKSRTFIRDGDWERRALGRLQGLNVILRPKPGRPAPKLGIPLDRSETIEQALVGKSLVVCRHSNVGVDAAISGVPCETDEGAASWLRDKPFTPAVRRDFLARLAYWQWKPSEARQAWKFLQSRLTLGAESGF